MKKIFLVTFLVASLARVFGISPVPYSEGVGVSFLLKGTNGTSGGGGSVTVYSEGTVSAGGNTNVESPVVIAWMRPFKQYTVSCSGTLVGTPTGTSGNCNLSFSAPIGYDVYINGALRDISSTSLASQSIQIPFNFSYTLEIRPSSEDGPTGASLFSGFMVGKGINWTVGLGGLSGGKSAGKICFLEKEFSTATAPLQLATRDRLYYTVPTNNSQITVIKDGASNQTLRQIITPQVAVDLVDDPSGGYWIKFYSSSSALLSGSIYTFSGSPINTLRVTAPTNTTLKVVESEGTVSKTSILESTSGMMLSGTYVATLTEGDGVTVLKSIKHSSSIPATGQRDDLEEVYTGTTAGTLVRRTKFHFENQPWGEELIQIVADPGGANLVQTYTYNTTSTALGNYRKIKSITEATGAWRSFAYYDDWNRRGRVALESRAFLDAPATVQTPSASIGRSSSYDYAPNYSGRSAAEISRITTITGTTASKRTSTITNGLVQNGIYYSRYVTNDYSDASTAIQTVTEIADPINANPGLNGATISIKHPDKSQESFSYTMGTAYLILTPYLYYTFTPSGTGAYMQRTVWHGSTDSTAGSLLSSYQGQSITPIYLVPNVSTKVDTLIDPAGLVLYESTSVFTGLVSGSPVYKTLTYSGHIYDALGRKFRSWENNGAVTIYTITNGQLSSVTESTGVVTNFTYDGIGRLKSSTKVGVAAGTYSAQPDIVTTYTLDALGNRTQAVVTGGISSLTSTWKYDLAGRMTEETPFDGSSIPLKKTYSYSPNSRVATITNPDLTTIVSENYLDGFAKSKTGSGCVPEFWTYSVDVPSGSFTTQKRFGSSSSPALVTTKMDWLQRTISTTEPALGGLTFNRSWSYNALGQLWKTSSSGRSDMLFEYDLLGRVKRSGLDVSGNGVLDLASADRIQERSATFYSDSNGGMWTDVIEKVYPSSTASPVVISENRSRLSNFSAGIYSESKSIDIAGNISSQTISVDPSNKVVSNDVLIGASSIHAISTYKNGLFVKSQDVNGITTKLLYDDLGRSSGSVDARTGTSSLTYLPGTTLVSTVVDAANVTQQTLGYDVAGRIKSSMNGLGKYVYYDYNSLGEKAHEWGSAANPSEYLYDSYGRLKFLKTYAASTADFSTAAWPATPGTGSYTFWDYNEATGLLIAKYDAANLDASGNPIANAKKEAYTYAVDRQIKTYTNARGIVRTNTYSPTTGEITGYTYTDTTPTVGFTYNRLGQLDTVTDAAGKRRFSYDLGGLLQLQNEEFVEVAGPFLGQRLSYQYDTTNVGTKGRCTGYTLGTNAIPNGEQIVSYGYQTDSRLASITGSASGIASTTLTYTYEPNSHLVQSVGNSSSGYLDKRTYDVTNDWVASRTATWGSTPVTKASFSYGFDAIGRITNVVKGGEVYSNYGNQIEGLKTSYAYDSLSQIIGEQTKVGTSSAILPGRDNGSAASPGYSYDKIGNRSSVTHNSNTSTYSPKSTSFNNVNQYSQRTVPGVFDVSGATTGSPVTVRIHNSNPIDTASKSGLYFFDSYPLANGSAPVSATLDVTVGSSTASLQAFLPKSPEIISYDDDGNMTNDGRWTYTYDAENRLLTIENLNSAESSGMSRRRLTFTYDYLGRRIKKVSESGWNTSTLKYDTVNEIRSIYKGFNLIAELDNNLALKKSYVWGIDLSGSETGGGGVGGLVLLMFSGSSYFPAYDSNGNIHGLIASVTGSLDAAYEYDAFGQNIRETGTLASSNPFRFSTKYTDIETGLICYGFRYYSPQMGRFITRDPSGERGGINLYGSCGNNLVCRYDVLGLSPVDDDKSKWSAERIRQNELYNHLYGNAHDAGSAQVDFWLNWSYDPTLYNVRTGNPIIQMKMDSMGYIYNPRTGRYEHPNDATPTEKKRFKEYEESLKSSRNSTKGSVKEVVDIGYPEVVEIILNSEVKVYNMDGSEATPDWDAPDNAYTAIAGGAGVGLEHPSGHFFTGVRAPDGTYQVLDYGAANRPAYVYANALIKWNSTVSVVTLNSDSEYRAWLESGGYESYSSSISQAQAAAGIEMMNQLVSTSPTYSGLLLIPGALNCVTASYQVMDAMKVNSPMATWKSFQVNLPFAPYPGGLQAGANGPPPGSPDGALLYLSMTKGWTPTSSVNTGGGG